MMTFSLKEALAQRGIALTDKALCQFEAYYHFLIEWNQKMNLTAITDYEEVMEKHFYDSLTPAFYHDFQTVSRLADIGAGAGFPSIPLKILYPHVEVTIVDSLKKRIGFLQELVRHLGLEGVECIHGRAEEVGRMPKYREAFPLVMARAVARLPVLVELTLPFVQVGGQFLALKGSSGAEEVNEAEKAIRVLGGKWLRTEPLSLPREQAQRTLIWIEKVQETPKTYPRKPGIPNKSPIL